jgi:hypothetical protein
MRAFLDPTSSKKGARRFTSPRVRPNSGLPEFGIFNWPKSDKSDFG